MSGSMWSCSGGHWMRAACVWSGVAVALSVLIGTPTSAEDVSVTGDGMVQVGESANYSPAPLKLRRPGGDGGRVMVDIRIFDLAEIEPAAFGDADE